MIREGGDGAAVAEEGVVLLPAASFVPEPVVWAWRDRVPLGALTLLVGDPGAGKSTLTIELAARASRGQLEGDLSGVPVAVVLATAEDAVAQVVVPRLLAAGADLARVHLVQVRRDGITGGLVLPDDVAALKDRVVAAGARFLVIDPFVAHLADTVNAHRDQDVRRAIAPLVWLAEEAAVAILGIVHLNKSDQAAVLSRVGGSVAFVAAARSVLLLGPDPDDREGPTRVLAHAKCNFGVRAPSLRLRLEARAVPGDEATIRTSGIAWAGEATGVRAADLIASETDEARDEGDEATAILRQLLRDGPRPAQDVQKNLRAAGVGERAWRRAKRDLRVRSEPAGFQGGWMWSLPSPPEASETVETGKSGAPTAENPNNGARLGHLDRVGRSLQSRTADLTAEEEARLAAEAAAGDRLAQLHLGGRS